jgi:universal stress protein A
MPFTRLMVGIDFSETSLIALEHGKALARESDADLEVLHVHEPPAIPPIAAAHPGGAPSTVVEAYDAGDVLHHSQRALRELLEAQGLQGRAVPMVRSGDPALTIAEAALEEKRDLVIVGTHGRSGLSRVVLGSVAEKVIRHSPCPVLVVPRPPESAS